MGRGEGRVGCGGQTSMSPTGCWCIFLGWESIIWTLLSMGEGEGSSHVPPEWPQCNKRSVLTLGCGF